MAVEPAVGIVVGVFLGLTADNAMGTAPLFLIVGLFLGGAAGMWNLFRAANRTTVSKTPDESASKTPDRTDGSAERPKSRSQPNENRGE